MSKISRIQADSYQQEIINEAVKRHFEEFHLKDRLCEESKVLIKPNLLMKRKPEEFTTTHPSLVEAAIIALKEMGVTRITVADSPGGLYNVSALKGIYDSSGMTEVCARQEVVLNEDVTFRELFNENAKLVKSFPIIKPVCDADFIIDICNILDVTPNYIFNGSINNSNDCFDVLPAEISTIYLKLKDDNKSFVNQTINHLYSMQIKR